MQTWPELSSRVYGKFKRRDDEILVWSLRQAINVLPCSVRLLPSLPIKNLAGGVMQIRLPTL